MERNPIDKRIDDLSGRVDRFEDKVDRRFERFEDTVDARFDRVDARFAAVLTKDEFKRAEEVGTMRFEFIAARMSEIDGRLDKWGRTMAGAVVVIAVGVIVKLLGA
jgi:hypothetical protein